MKRHILGEISFIAVRCYTQAPRRDPQDAKGMTTDGLSAPPTRALHTSQRKIICYFAIYKNISGADWGTYIHIALDTEHRHTPFVILLCAVRSFSKRSTSDSSVAALGIELIVLAREEGVATLQSQAEPAVRQVLLAVSEHREEDEHDKDDKGEHLVRVRARVKVRSKVELGSGLGLGLG